MRKLSFVYPRFYYITLGGTWQFFLCGIALDLEYNKNGRFAKRIPARIRGAFPDLIIHKRGINDGNLLIVEFKTWWDPDTSKDEVKLRQFVDPTGEYGYSAGKSITLAKARENVKIWTYTKGAADVVF